MLKMSEQLTDKVWFDNISRKLDKVFFSLDFEPIEIWQRETEEGEQRFGEGCVSHGEMI